MPAAAAHATPTGFGDTTGLRLDPVRMTHRPSSPFAHHRHRQLPAAAAASATPSWPRELAARRHRDLRRVDRRAHRHPRAPLRRRRTSPCSDLARRGGARARSRRPDCDAERHRPDHRRHLDAGHGVPVGRLHPAAQARRRTAAPAFDVQAVCSGFVYALTVADSMIRTGSAQRGAGDRRRGLLAHPRLQRPHHLRAVRRRRRRGRARGERRRPASWRASCMPTAATSTSCARRARSPAARCSATRC